MHPLAPFLERLILAVERLSPTKIPSDLSSSTLVWRGDSCCLQKLDIILPSLGSLSGLEDPCSRLTINTQAFAAGERGLHALLWGARGTGKSTLVKAVFAHVQNAMPEAKLTLVGLARHDLKTLPALFELLRTSQRRFIVFCDDLSFDDGEHDYKFLKTSLEGGLSSCPENVLFYATSNQRHLLARDAIEQDTIKSLHQRDVMDERLALVDRFGLWIGFHPLSQDDYLAIVHHLALHQGCSFDAQLDAKAKAWSLEKGERSGRTAQQFVIWLKAQQTVGPNHPD